MAERLFSSLPYLENKDRLFYVIYKELINLGKNSLGLLDIDLFVKEQYENGEVPYTEFKVNSYLGWIEGRRLLSGVGMFDIIEPDKFEIIRYVLYKKREEWA